MFHERFPMKFLNRFFFVGVLAGAMLAVGLPLLGFGVFTLVVGSSSDAARPSVGLQPLVFPSAVGPALDWEVRAMDGRTANVADLDHTVLFVNNWATWCGPCIRELPSLKRLNARLGGEEFVVLALSQDRGGWARMSPFLEKHDLGGLPAFHDPKAMAARAAKVGALPTSVLYGRDGRELGRLTGHAEWDSDEALALIRHYTGG